MKTSILPLILAVPAVIAAGCNEEALAPKPKPVASAPSAAPAASSAAPAKVAFDPEDLKSYPVLPARFESDKNPITEPKVTLGRMLFFEPRLSKNHDVSCNSCHDLTKFGVDGQRFSDGHKKQKGGRNAPTVYNAGNHVAQFWDGRAATIEDQAKGPILNPVEMAMPNEKKVIEVLKSIPGYPEAFKAAFPKDADPVTYDNLAKSIGAFERQLVTPSRFDKFRAGDEDALTQKEKEGFAKFIKLGCPTCHTGPAVGGTTFQKLGLVKPYPDQSDLGRFQVTKNESDKMYFRVPSLRNVAKTAPYFHNGSLETLPVVVRTMAHHQLGVELTDPEVDMIVAFLSSLTGELPGDYIKPPVLPPSGPKTPKPDPT
ncbi:MAG: cytochrome-c peroxidase [Byssovorax sp.]